MKIKFSICLLKGTRPRRIYRKVPLRTDEKIIKSFLISSKRLPDHVNKARQAQKTSEGPVRDKSCQLLKMMERIEN